MNMKKLVAATALALMVVGTKHCASAGKPSILLSNSSTPTQASTSASTSI